MPSGAETKPIPPVPEHTPPREGDLAIDQKTLIARAWAEWFRYVREKVNLINLSLANLSGASGSGLLVGNNGSWLFRTIQSVIGQTTVSNGNGVAGDPTIGLADVPDTGTGALRAFNKDAKGRITGTKAITITGTAGQVNVTDGDGVAGNPTISLDAAVTTAIATVIFPPMTLAAANALTGVAYGQAVLITDVATGAEPCWYDTTIPSGTKWRKCTDRSIAT